MILWHDTMTDNIYSENMYIPNPKYTYICICCKETQRWWNFYINQTWIFQICLIGFCRFVGFLGGVNFGTHLAVPGCSSMWISVATSHNEQPKNPTTNRWLNLRGQNMLSDSREIQVGEILTHPYIFNLYNLFQKGRISWNPTWPSWEGVFPEGCFVFCVWSENWSNSWWEIALVKFIYFTEKEEKNFFSFSQMN